MEIRFRLLAEGTRARVRVRAGAVLDDRVALRSPPAWQAFETRRGAARARLSTLRRGAATAPLDGRG